MDLPYLFERIRIQLEIIGESIMDALGSYANVLRKPLMFLAGVALFMTLRTARRGVSTTKKYSSAHDLPNYRPVRPTAMASAATSSYRPATSSTSGILGGLTARATGAQTAPTTATMGGAGRATADLVDMHGSTVMVMDASALKNYGGATEFQGVVETVTAFESPAMVEQILAQSGHGKVLVVDGGASLRSSIFDSSAASTAQRNGWQGVILNGAVRHAKSLAAIPFGVKALGTTPIKGRSTTGQRGQSLNFGGVQISPGWFIYADQDGIVVSQRELTAGLLGTSQQPLGAMPTTTNQYSAGGATYPNTATSQYGAGATYPGTATSQYGAGAAYPSTSTSQYGASATYPGTATSQYGTGMVGSVAGHPASAMASTSTAATAHRAPPASTSTALRGSTSTTYNRGSTYSSRPAGASSYYNYGKKSTLTLKKKILILTGCLILVRCVW